MKTVLTTALLAFALTACSKDAAESSDKASPTAEKKSKAKAEAKPTVPTETELLDLSPGTELPVTIKVPKGSTTFKDGPKQIRVSYAKGEAFGVQVAAGNEYNTNLKETADGLKENKYGSTNEILEQTDTLLKYKMTSESKHVSHKFNQIIKLGEATYVCKQGNHGGWTVAQMEQQLAACKTLAAK